MLRDLVKKEGLAAMPATTTDFEIYLGIKDDEEHQVEFEILSDPLESLTISKNEIRTGPDVFSGEFATKLKMKF